ncbi:MAG: DUF4124 domain-containing protein [Pseudomonadota bacterium]
MVSKFLLPLMLAAAVLPAQAKMYKWVDAQGKVHYTDTPPPESAKQGNAELSKTGNVIRKTESAEERQKRLAAEAEAAARQREAEDQARKDRALLATYTTEEEIDLARDRAIEQRGLAIKSAQARMKLIEPGMKDLEAKVKEASKSGKPVPAYLQQLYDAKRAEMEEVQRIIKTNEEAIEAARQRYEAEKQRFRELTAGKR